ncbi:hypothetical protein M0813_25498 [Anaeramoeba flamelloides]|uniref:Uncharacterized protein n=1 Tax=Anaeramoeba flamelloides TaxID=1746091 RepID=A0ABQ8Y249_9EUKA|nr:hypothetical protein M0813_25498 [Anaeramoeba flamelloides]
MFDQNFYFVSSEQTIDERLSMAKNNLIMNQRTLRLPMIVEPKITLMSNSRVRILDPDIKYKRKKKRNLKRSLYYEKDALESYFTKHQNQGSLQLYQQKKKENENEKEKEKRDRYFVQKIQTKRSYKIKSKSQEVNIQQSREKQFAKRNFLNKSQPLITPGEPKRSQIDLLDIPPSVVIPWISLNLGKPIIQRKVRKKNLETVFNSFDSPKKKEDSSEILTSVLFDLNVVNNVINMANKGKTDVHLGQKALKLLARQRQCLTQIEKLKFFIGTQYDSIFDSTDFPSFDIVPKIENPFAKSKTPKKQNKKWKNNLANVTNKSSLSSKIFTSSNSSVSSYPNSIPTQPSIILNKPTQKQTQSLEQIINTHREDINIKPNSNDNDNFAIWDILPNLTSTKNNNQSENNIPKKNPRKRNHID